MFAPKQAKAHLWQKIELSACQQIELLQTWYILISMLIGWKMVETLELPLAANYIPQQNIPQVQITD
jgi:hypothetical protein